MGAVIVQDGRSKLFGTVCFQATLWIFILFVVIAHLTWINSMERLTRFKNRENPDQDTKEPWVDLDELETKDPPRILCWILTSPQTLHTKAIHVRNTWGSRCQKLLFVSSEEDPKIEVVALKNVTEGREWLWAKTRGAMEYIWKTHGQDYDWFLKADDDTYIVMENLQRLLSDYEPTMPIWFGCRFKYFIEQGYMSGGAGYTLSREALRRFVEIALPDPKICYRDHDGPEDKNMGVCLDNVGVIGGDSRDSQSRHRFFALPPNSLLNNETSDMPSWYPRYMFYPFAVGEECCSDTAIGFHYIEPKDMYFIEYLLYRLRPFVNERIPVTTPKLIW